MSVQVDPGDTQLRRNAIGARHIVFFVVAAAAPLGFAVGAIPLAIGRGGIGVSGMFLVVGAILLVFAVGYVAMAKHVRRAGGLYVYVSEGLGQTMGLGTAFVATAAYAVAATGAVGIFAVLAQSVFLEFFLIETPWVLWALIATLLMGLLGVLRVELNARVLGVVMVCEVAILLVIGAVIVISGGAEGLSLSSFSPAEVFGVNPGVLLAVVISAFAGFEATVLYVEEVRSPERSIPRATYGAIIVLVAFYAFVSWAVIQAFGNAGAVEIAASDPVGMFFAAADGFLGLWAVALLGVLVVTSWFASILAFHNATTRYLFALGRDQAIPRKFASLSPKFGSPMFASLTHTAFTLIIVLAFALAGADPYLDLYVLGSTPAVVAIPVMECLAAAAIVAYFARDRRGMSVWRVIVAPTASGLALLLVTFLIITQLDIFTTRGAAVNAALVGVVFLALIAGVVRALWLKQRNPAVYVELGRPSGAEDAAS